jgi:hypothetical protein
MIGWKLPPDPYTAADRAAALPDDFDHEVVDPLRTGQGPGIRCGQLVSAPTSSAYGIRPCLSVTIEINGQLRHYNYPERAGRIDFTTREVGR